MNLTKIVYDQNKIKLKCLYENLNSLDYCEKSIKSDKISYVYGNLDFLKKREDRPITIASFVSSIDGKIAFVDKEEGPLIASKNFLDLDGGMADFWILNMLRANCDAIICGAGTLAKEKDFTGHVFDKDLENDKKLWNIIISFDGSDIVYDHLIFESGIPIIIATSPDGLKNVLKNLEKPSYVIDRKNPEVKENMIPIIITGHNSFTDSKELFEILKKINIDRLLVESPTYAHHLIELKMLDEMFLNYSCIYLGGKAPSLGSNSKSFLSDDHPHTKLVSIHMHSQHFLYFRHQFVYGIKS